MGSSRYAEPVRNEESLSYDFKSDTLTLEKPRYYIYKREDEEVIAWPFYFFCNACVVPWCFTLPVDCHTGLKTVKGNAMVCPRCGGPAGEFCDIIREMQ